MIESKKIKDIEILRCLAVVMVIVAHVPYFGRFLKPLFLQSWTGVDLFFVISGCVVSLSLLTSLPKHCPTDLFDRMKAFQIPLRNFFVRRLFRITPSALVWAVVPLTLALTFNTSGIFATKSLFGAVNQLLAVATFQFNYLYLFNLVPNDLGPYWSLSVEEHFYLILPFFFLLVPGNQKRFTFSVVIILVLTFLVRPLFQLQTEDPQLAWQWMRYASHNRFDSLFLGVLLGILRYEKVQGATVTASARVLMWILIGVLWLLPAMEIGAPLYGFQVTVINVLCFGIVYFASANADVLHCGNVVSRVMIYLGSRSYALYLIHFTTYKLTEEVSFRIELTNVTLKLGLFVALTLGLAELSVRLLERPLMDFGRRYLVNTTGERI